MRFGIVTPVLTLLPKAHARWEREGTVAEVVRIAQHADRLGIHHLTCAEHVVVPADVAQQRGGRYFDPPATLGYLAAVTERIRLATSVIVLGYHHPLEIAKRYGTLDTLSGGRLILGVGVGSLREEFDLIGAPFDDRGARADEALAALRATLSNPTPEFHGQYFDYADVVLDPCAVQSNVPLWVGGRTRRSLRRAVQLADGWCPFGLTPAEVTAMIEQEGAPSEVVLQPTRALDPGGQPDATIEAVDGLAAAGATTVQVRMIHQSLEHYLEQMQALQELFPSLP